MRMRNVLSGHTADEVPKRRDISTKAGVKPV